MCGKVIGTSEFPKLSFKDQREEEVKKPKSCLAFLVTVRQLPE